MAKQNLKIILTFLILSPVVLFSQPKKIQRANQFYEKKQFFTAIELYLKLYPKIKERETKAEVAFKLGDSYRQVRDFRNATIWFKRAIGFKYQDPKVYLYYADVLKARGEFEEAKTNYNIYLELVPTDVYAENALKSIDLAQEWINKPSRYLVSPLPGMINSKDDDYACFVVPTDTNLIYFTSNRTATKGSKLNPSSAKPFADIYWTRKDVKGIWSQPQPVDINTPFDDGAAVTDKDGTVMYFTHCPFDKSKDLPCSIMMATKSENKWTNVIKLKFFTDTNISVGHPYLSPDELTLYFVAETPNGYGGKDIWYVTRSSKNSSWSSPQLLPPPINSQYNEIFPSIDNEKNLYFASDRPEGMGGFDIYKATKNNSDWIVSNLKYPINSTADDFAITFNSYDNSYGYFSSNREGRGDDIFSFYLKPIEIQLIGYVINDANKAYVPDVDVEISATDGSLFKIRTNYDGKFTTKLKPNLDYNLITNKKGFLKTAYSFSTKGITEDNKKLEVILHIVPAIGVIKIPNIRYNFNDTTLREESKVALDELVELLRVNPNVVIELRANTDSRGDEKYNLRLSQGRANSVVNYLVSKGIDRKRLVPIGLGKSTPFVVDKVTSETYPFLKEGQVLDDKFINSLPSEEQKEICHELNRRTEFRVIKEDYKQFEKFGD